MLLKKFDESKIRSILLISLSNLGDVILTFPVIDILKRDIPRAHLSVVVGPKAQPLLNGNPYIKKVYIFDKNRSGLQKLSWLISLQKKKFDLVVDLRNTAIPFLILARYRTPPQFGNFKTMHMKTKHLNRLRSILNFETESKRRYALFPSASDVVYVDNILREDMQFNKKFFVVAPGAANHIKRWTPQGFAGVCDQLMESLKVKIIFVGDQHDIPIVNAINQLMHHKALNLCAQTTLTQLAELLRRATLVVTNDSAIMHMASYLNIPIVAIFGPTDPKKYGPWSSQNFVVQKRIFCSPCEKSGCRYHHECMNDIQPSEILNIVHQIYGSRHFLKTELDTKFYETI